MNIENKIFAILSSLPSELSFWLENKFISLGKNSWWEQFVYPTLSYQQTELVKRKDIKTLQKLDLSALLRILDKNWYHITKDGAVEYSNRTYIKQMQQIRNRFAHFIPGEITKDEIPEILNVILNFVKIISCEDKYRATINEIETVKIDDNCSEQIDSGIIYKESTNENISEKIMPGDMICLKSDKNVSGAVIKITGMGDDKKYTVFLPSGQ